MNSKRIWQNVVAATLVAATVGTVALAADTLGALPAGGSLQLASNEDRDEHRDYREERAEYNDPQRIGIEQALAAVTAAGYRNVQDIERDGRGYEAKAFDAEGRRWELQIDGRSGEIIGRERD
ncbi:MAG: Peptidase propeptide and domain [Pseudomonadota bacterium]|jgi:hypothetical protein